MITVALLVTLAIGLLAGYSIGSSGPCPDCDGIETAPKTADGTPYVLDNDGTWRGPGPCLREGHGHGLCATVGNHYTKACRYV